MARKHALVIALALGLAAAAGGLAAINTAKLGQPQAHATASSSQTAALAKRTRMLDRQQAALKRALAQRPPKLPKVPRFTPVSTPSAAAPPAQLGSAPQQSAPAQPRMTIQYVRPAPIVVTKHRSDGEDEHEEEGGGDD